MPTTAHNRNVPLHSLLVLIHFVILNYIGWNYYKEYIYLKTIKQHFMILYKI